jgi:ribosome-associated translation inhibitor RaiA
MIISTSSHNIQLTRELDKFVESTVQGSLERLADDLVSIDVFLKDLNGPKGGIDKQVVIRIHMRGRREVAIETVHENLAAAIRVGAKRAKRAVRRSLRKSRRIEKFRISRRLDSLPSSLNA